ncbi:MAG: hypothetical protein E6Q97_15930 [Desulfurellales bacterium]|nr:MAG: hypothetical protein E6Q97_15930 [Desulfurellales bacterium]
MYNKTALKELWHQAIIKSLMAPAQRLLDGEPKRRRSGDGTTTLIKIIPLVIVSLSLASVTNMASRAWEHHASYSSYAIGLGLAIMVPVIVFTALRLDSRLAKGFAWLCAVLFAFASGSIQFQIYNAGQPITIDTLFSVGVNLEALAFGFGVPFAECVLAGLEGLLVWQIESKERHEATQAKAAELEHSREAEAQAKASQEAAERKERERMEWQAEQDRKRQEWQAEQDRIAAEHAQRLELERQKAEAKLHKSMHKPAQNDAQESNSTTGRTTPDMQNIVHLSKQEQAKHLHSEGFSNTEIAKLLEVHRNSVGNWLKETNGHSKAH